jgi:hypothetical protein
VSRVSRPRRTSEYATPSLNDIARVVVVVVVEKNIMESRKSRMGNPSEEKVMFHQLERMLLTGEFV